MIRRNIRAVETIKYLARTLYIFHTFSSLLLTLIEISFISCPFKASGEVQPVHQNKIIMRIFSEILQSHKDSSMNFLRLCLDQGFGEGKEKRKVSRSKGPEQLDPLTFTFPFAFPHQILDPNTA